MIGFMTTVESLTQRIVSPNKQLVGYGHVGAI